MNAQPPVVAIFGPTGSGKTDVAVEVARALNTRVVNCDPAQCYDGFPILTNKPTAEHDAIARHELIGCWPLTHDAKVAEFAPLARRTIDTLIEENGSAVVAGGSGLYMRAALYELSLGRAHNDAGGLWEAPARHATHVVWLHTDRALLRERIGRRTEAMFDNGLLDEVAAVVGRDGADEAGRLSPTAAKLHGLQDCRALLAGAIDDREAVRRMTTRTRQYAKRQDTWARRWPQIVEIDLGISPFDASHIARLVLNTALQPNEL